MAATDSAVTAGNKYRLPVRFLQKYAQRPVQFGFGDLGEFVYRRTYARQGEVWWQTVKRVVEGTMNMWRRNLDELGKTLDEAEIDKIAQDMYERIFNFKFLPPGRGLWAMGTPITEERHNYTALNNCAFISTWAENSDRRYSYPFCFVFEASMLGVGCGFDTEGAGKIPLRVYQIGDTVLVDNHVIEDSREGWTHALRLLLDHFIYGDVSYTFDLSAIRPKGSPITGFGGVASGPEPLKWALDKILEILDEAAAAKQQFMTSRNIVDIMNIIGKCVVSGNVRRTALIALGRPDDHEFLDLKNYTKNPERMQFGWTSNNSVVVRTGKPVDYDIIAQRIWDNGEPGVVWLDNARKHARMCERNTWEDDVKGVNPCGEQTLEDGELCCLVEVFPMRCYQDPDHTDIKETIKSALLYAKIVSTGETLWPETNAIMKRNRRIGLSLSGITQYMQTLGTDEDRQRMGLGCRLHEWYKVVRCYDKKIGSKWFGRESIKLTTVKPSGTISLLAGATPGVHYPIARYYIRRVRVASDHELLPCLTEAGYHIESDRFSPGTVVVEFLVDSGVDKTESTVPPEDQMRLTALMQRCWSDNSVSVTIKFDKEKTSPGDIAKMLKEYQGMLKSVSMLPQSKDVYPQMPYEEIDKETYHARVKKLKPVQWPQPGEGAPDAPMFCDADGCAV
jgi:adenosylcobalamin-dependent ribonucleoside-triphosphate reductase